MDIINPEVLDDFVRHHAVSRRRVLRWASIVESADWRSPHDAQREMSGVRPIGDGRMIFNVGGNNYRLVASFNFTQQRVWIDFIGTHDDYDEERKRGFSPWRSR